MAERPLVITGPTAAGKTAVSLEVAERVDGEIISMDSRQVFRGMDIGTAKATPEQRRRVPHHGIDLVDPSERYSAGRFSRDARRWIEEIAGRGRIPILVGGTGFFLKALTDPLFREPELPADRRERLKRYLDEQPRDRLERWLAALDARLLDRLRARQGGSGRQRLARGIEVALLSGQPLSWWHAQEPAGDEPVTVRVFVLSLPLEALDRRIDQRVVEMVEMGLVDEVRDLVAGGYDHRDPGMNATGYIEMLPYLRGERTLEEAIADIQRATRRYARRQLTWFRHQLPSGAVWLDARRPVRELAEIIAERREEAL